MSTIRPLKTLDRDELEALYKAHTGKEIEYMFNCDISVLYRLLNAHKIPRKHNNRRPKGCKGTPRAPKRKIRTPEGTRVINYRCSAII
tara:strand:- start:143 stop:406 length:264 start_codon:yes stop_codon:yes gene_type:complete